MAAVTVAPAVEAMIAIRDRINSGTAYVIASEAEYSELQVDELESVDGLRVDVTSEDETQLAETLALEDRTSHNLRIWIRSPLERRTNDEIDPLKLVVRQIYQRINNYDSADLRVRVWTCDLESKQNPDKAMMNQQGLFVSSITLRVEVEAS
jgi:hypothetical protein